MWFTRMTDGTTRTPDSNRDFPNNFWRAEFFSAWVVAKCGIKYFEFILQPLNTFIHLSKSRSRSLYLSFENLNWMLCIWTTTAAAAATTYINRSKGGFPLSRNFYVRTRVQITYLNEMEAMYEMPRVDAKIEQVSAFTFTCDLSCKASTLFTRVPT